MSRPSFLVRLLRRRRRDPGPSLPSAPQPPVAPGQRETKWLLVGHERARTARLAAALAERGAEVILVWRGAAAVQLPACDGLQVLDSFSLSGLRRVFAGQSVRKRVVIEVADAETIALARDLSAAGARVGYDALPARGAPSQVLSYDAETERALVAAVEDLIAVDARGARHLAALSSERRLVHVLPDGEGDAGWAETAAGLESVAARPSVVVLLTIAEGAADPRAAVEAFVAGRSDGAYRLVVVIGPADPVGEDLEAREEAGELRLLRCPRPGRAAAWNLGLAATASEFVVLADASQTPKGPGWLAAALAGFDRHRELGAMGFPAPSALLPGAGGTREGSKNGPRALHAPGLMAPREVLNRCGDFDEELDAGGLSWVDLSFRIRDLGLRLAVWPDEGLQGGPREVAEPDAALRRLLARRWAARPGYLAGDS